MPIALFRLPRLLRSRHLLQSPARPSLPGPGRSWRSDHHGALWIHAAAREPVNHCPASLGPWYSATAPLPLARLLGQDPEEIAAVEEQYRRLYSLDGVGDVQFPPAYPTSCLLGCVDVAACLSQEELGGLPLSDSQRLESDSAFVFLCQSPRRLVRGRGVARGQAGWGCESCHSRGMYCQAAPRDPPPPPTRRALLRTDTSTSRSCHWRCLGSTSSGEYHEKKQRPLRSDSALRLSLPASIPRPIFVRCSGRERRGTVCLEKRRGASWGGGLGGTTDEYIMFARAPAPFFETAVCAREVEKAEYKFKGNYYRKQNRVFHSPPYRCQSRECVPRQRQNYQQHQHPPSSVCWPLNSRIILRVYSF